MSEVDDGGQGGKLVPTKEGASELGRLIEVYREAHEKSRGELLDVKGSVAYYTGISGQHEVRLENTPVLPDIVLGLVLDKIAENQTAHQVNIGKFLYDVTSIPAGERTPDNIKALMLNYEILEGFSTWRLLQDELMGKGRQRIMWGWAWDNNTYYEYDIPHRLQTSDWISFIGKDLDAVLEHLKDAFSINKSTLLSVLGRVIVSLGVDSGLYRRIGEEKVMGPSPATFLVCLMDAFERKTSIRQRVEEIVGQIPSGYRHQARWEAYLLSLPDEAQQQLIGKNRLSAILGIVRQLARVSGQTKLNSGVSLPDSREERVAYGQGFSGIIRGMKDRAEEFNDRSIASLCADMIRKYDEGVRRASVVINGSRFK